jgi:hypothetical protein
LTLRNSSDVVYGDLNYGIKPLIGLGFVAIA